MSFTLDAVECLLSSARGQYIPRDFVANCDMAEWGIDPESWEANTCAAGPDEEGYWDAWEVIMNKARFSRGGVDWVLHQDDDLWMLCYELMTEEEKFNFGFDNDF